MIVDAPTNSPQSQTVKKLQIRNQEIHFRLCKPQLNIKVPDSTGTKKNKWTGMICLEGLPGKNLFSLKELDSTV